MHASPTPILEVQWQIEDGAGLDRGIRKYSASLSSRDVEINIQDDSVYYMAANRAASATTKYKAACDKCHVSKVKCPGGGPPCQRCADSCYSCNYRLTTRMGKPPGSRNKKTLERLRRAGQVNAEKDTGDASNGSGLDAHFEHGESNSSRDACRAYRAQILPPMSPIMEPPSFSGSSCSSPPLAHDLFNENDACIDRDDISALWSGDIELSDLDKLRKDDFRMPWAGTGDAHWSVSDARIFWHVDRQAKKPRRPFL